ncbi:chemotaxis protein CheW [Mesorhizobium sp.]|uniref:chemotaxis protein CheW n=1 Tax=Mesorhizobium sp. TaxID=1871066 RepID=UPI000FE4CB2E|nr:chemotaxis protein CheW [Mesorhizobium sp.]RWB51829.1 MAG: chemotaxis protein CheW [Mesorhizobium sp.]
MAAQKSREPIDWAVIRERLAAATQATGSVLNPPPEKRQKKLEARAIALAVSGSNDEATRAVTIAFELSGNRYEIEIRYVRGVVSVGQVTPLPRTPDYVVGVYDLHGQLLPVFDLRIPLGITEKPPLPPRWAIVCGEAQPEFLITIDAISSISNLPADCPALLEKDNAWVRGVAADGRTILDGGAILNDRRFFLEDRPSTQIFHSDRAS